MGIEKGVSLRFESSVRSVEAPNLPSAYQWPSAIEKDIEAELKAGRLAGPFASPPCLPFRCNPLGVVEKDGGKGYRIIDHLSFPKHGDSVNAGIKDFSVSYPTIDSAAKWLRRMKNASMAKVDLKSAFRQIAVRREDYGLLGMKWNGSYYYRKCLPFGSRSSPAIFSEYSEAIAWMARRTCGTKAILVYLDDFLLIAKDKSTCQSAVVRLRELLMELGVEENQEKFIAPTQCLVYLGIELDSKEMVARLHQERLKELRALVGKWRQKKTITKQELQSLVGKLSFAARCVTQSRIYLRRLINLIPFRANKTRHIHITVQARQDMVWWDTFMTRWNGVSMLAKQGWVNVGVQTDASGWGCGAVYGTRWIQREWSVQERSLPMPVLELTAVAIAIRAWAGLWRGRRIMIQCDCLPAVQAFNRLTSPSSRLMDVVRMAHQITIESECVVLLRHVAGVDNQVADALSRNKVRLFRSLVPQARRFQERPQPWPIRPWL